MPPGARHHHDQPGRISQVTRELGITAFYVTHDQREALALSNIIAVMNQGRIVQFDSPEAIYRAPADDFVARFVGYTNAIPVHITDGGVRIESDGSALVAPDVMRQGAATAFIHASSVVLEPGTSSGPNCLLCTVLDTAFMGDYIEYLLHHEAGLQLKARTPVGAPVFARNAMVVAILPADKMIIVPRT